MNGVRMGILDIDLDLAEYAWEAAEYYCHYPSDKIAFTIEDDGGYHLSDVGENTIHLNPTSEPEDIDSEMKRVCMFLYLYHVMKQLITEWEMEHERTDD